MNQSVDDVDEGAVLAQCLHFVFDALHLFLGLATFGTHSTHTVLFGASTLATATATASATASASAVTATFASTFPFFAVASGRRVTFRFGAGAGAAAGVVGAVVAFVVAMRAASVVFAVSVSTFAVVFAFHAGRGFVAGAGASLGRRRRFGGVLLARLAAFAAARRGRGVAVFIVVPFFLVHFVTGFLHQDLGDTLFDVGRVLNKALVDGRLRFGFRFDEVRIGVGVFEDRNSAFVRGVPFSVAIARISGGACLERLFHAIFDHLHFGAGLDGEHAPHFHFHLFAA